MDVGEAAPGKSSVAERLQPLHQRRIETGFLCQFLAGGIVVNYGCQFGPQFFRNSLLVTIEILQFLGVFAEIVQFRLGSENKVIALILDSAQFAPIEMEAGKKGLGV